MTYQYKVLKDTSFNQDVLTNQLNVLACQSYRLISCNIKRGIYIFEKQLIKTDNKALEGYFGGKIG